MQWIDVKDRLPQEAGHYLVVKAAYKRWPAFHSIAEFAVNPWHVGWASDVHRNTHWMPLPELPTTKE